MTLEVAIKDAQKLTLAAGIGQLSLALREVASDAGETTQRVTTTDLIGEMPESVAALEKVEPVVVAAPAPEVREVEVVKEVIKYLEPKRPVRATVGVFRGMDRQEYDVPRYN